MIGFEFQLKTIKKYSVLDDRLWGSTKKYSVVDNGVWGSTKNYQKI